MFSKPRPELELSGEFKGAERKSKFHPPAQNAGSVEHLLSLLAPSFLPASFGGSLQQCLGVLP